MTRTEFLREQALSGANKCMRAPFPKMSVADEPFGIATRKALALKLIFEHMPVYIGPRELIVGTRTWFSPNKGNEDGHSIFEYGLSTRIPYINDEDIKLFGCDQSYYHRTHYAPDFGIVLDNGIDGILKKVEQKQADASLNHVNHDFLDAVDVAWQALKTLILRYANEADTLAQQADGEDKSELLEIARICRKISGERPETFHEAVQLLWFAHLGTIIENFEFISYGRLDVLLGPFLGDTPRDEAQQIIECLLLKMYDQTDLVTSYLGRYASQLIVTLGGVLQDGENAVNEVTMMFLEGIGKIRLPDPEFNLRISTKNPPEFLDKAAELTVSGCNFVSYYNDDLFVESLHRAGLPLEEARRYGFDLCQDMNIPGRGDFWLVANPILIDYFMSFLKSNRDFSDFCTFFDSFKTMVAKNIKNLVEKYNISEKQLSLYAEGRFEEYFDGIRNQGKPADRFDKNSPMSPLPLLSALFHGCIENALDVAFEPYPLKDKGFFFRAVVETVNSLAAIKKTVFDENRFTLDEIYTACESDFAGKNGNVIKNILWNCPKWGNDNDFVDSIAKELIEFCLRECQQYKTYLGGQVLGGIHQPHPVITGERIMATPEGRNAGAPVAVTLTPESGTMRNGPTAVLASASKIDPMLVQWNYCVMVNYFASVFKGNEGKEIFKTLLTGYFKSGGLQHQPNILDVEEMKRAQLESEKYRDLIVRLWGVSAHFVDLPREIQDEMIARFA